MGDVPRPDGWRALAADPVGDELDRALEDLLGRLEAASAAAQRLVGRAPAGVRIIDLADGAPHAVCAFEGGGVLCLGPDLRVATGRRVVRRHIAAGVLWEHVEALLNDDRLDALATAGGRLLAQGLDADVAEHVQAAVQATVPLRAWRNSPMRAVASVAQLDVLVAMQDDLHRAFTRFVTASEPLVEHQDRLAEELVTALAAFERAAGAAGVAERLAGTIAAAMPACDEAAEEITATHLTPLGGTG